MAWRNCVDCGKPYDLPVDYDKANPLIRDRCVECISVMQHNHEKINDGKEEWFT